MSQRELASRAGLDVTAISFIERGLREPRLQTLIKLAGGLGVTLNDLTMGLFEWVPSTVPAQGGSFVPVLSNSK